MNELIAGKIAAPKDLPADAVSSVGTPNTLPADSAGIVGTPNTVPSDSAGIIAAPISLTSATAAALPRSLTPMVEFDFAAKRYVQDGVAVAFEDIFTYTRASSATFTNRRAKKNGGYEYFLDTDYVGDVTNSMLYSEDFSKSPWVGTSATSTVNQLIAPDGTLTANKITYPVASYAWLGQNQYTYTNNDVVTFSAYYKAGSITKVLHNFYRGNVDAYIKVDLLSGAILNSVNTIESSVVNVGDGWYKLSVTALVSVAAGAKAQVARQEGAELTSGGYIYAWGAQVTESAKVLPYVKTLDVAVTKTFAETLRTEYDAVTGKNLGALIEGGSTNLALHSEDFSNAAWVKGDSTILSNEIVAPDDTFSVDKINAATSASIAPRVSQTITANISSTYTVSYYVKKAEASIVQIYFGGSDVANNPRVNFNLITGSVGSQDNDIVSATINPIKNDIYRITATVVAAVATGFTAGIVAIKSTTDTRAQANAWTIGDGVYVWGAQIEREPFVTSYIRTEGSAVSRSADNLHLPASGNVSFLDSTVHVVFDDDSNPFDYPNIYTHNGVGGNLRVFRGPSGGVYSTFRTGNVATTYDGVGQVSITSTIDAVTQKVYKNGVLGNSAATSYPTPTINNALHLYLGSVNSASGQSISGHISKFSTYAQALTQQEITLL